MVTEGYHSPMGREPAEDERQLISELKQGLPGALEKLFRRYWKPIMRLCLARLENTAEAEDAAIETFADAARGIKNFRGESRLSTWLFRICINRINKHYRQHRRQPETVSLDDCPEAAMIQPNPQEDEQILRLRQALNRLPPKDRLLLIIYYQEEVPISELATILHLSPGAVKMRLNRARAKLRKEMERSKR